MGNGVGTPKEPERLRIGLEEMIRREEEGLRRNPKGEIEAWLKDMSEADAKRRRYQEMAAEGLIEFGELRERLQGFDEEKEIADREVQKLREKSERIQKMRRNKDALLERIVEITPSRTGDRFRREVQDLQDARAQGSYQQRRHPHGDGGACGSRFW